MKQHYRTIVLSDIHLGSRNCHSELLNDFLKKTSSDYLYLNGDIIDTWKIGQRNWSFGTDHGKLLLTLIKISQKKSTKVVYIAGNHDEFIRHLIPFDFTFGNITVCNEIIHIGKNGKQYIITHGDIFDGIVRIHHWISVLGDHGYEFLIRLNKYFNAIRKLLGFNYWSLSAAIKRKIKGAVNYINDFEQTLIHYCRQNKCDGTIVGHIHTPDIKMIGDIEYMNSGDWVESCTALVETVEGEWKIIFWDKIENAHTNI